jgi:hypothetical protein
MIESENPNVEKLITFLYRKLVGDALLFDGNEQKVEGEVKSLEKTCAGNHLSAGLVAHDFLNVKGSAFCRKSNIPRAVS